MLHPLAPALLALAAPVLIAGDGATPPPTEGQITTMTFHERIIIRVPRMTPPPPRIAWVEKEGPNCIEADKLAGALVPAPGVVDLVLKGNKRVRAQLGGMCEPLDFYSGFYLKPAADGKICAGRDEIRARSGVSCAIGRFLALKPVKAKRGSDVVSGRR